MTAADWCLFVSCWPLWYALCTICPLFPFPFHTFGPSVLMISVSISACRVHRVSMSPPAAPFHDGQFKYGANTVHAASEDDQLADQRPQECTGRKSRRKKGEPDRPPLCWRGMKCKDGGCCAGMRGRACGQQAPSRRRVRRGCVKRRVGRSRCLRSRRPLPPAAGCPRPGRVANPSDIRVHTVAATRLVCCSEIHGMPLCGRPSEADTGRA